MGEMQGLKERGGVGRKQWIGGRWEKRRMDEGIRKGKREWDRGRRVQGEE